MFANEQLPAEILANPSALQAKTLNVLKDYTNGLLDAPSPNNTVNLLLDATTSIISQSVLWQQQVFDKIYPRRATTMAELYPHLSDYDYVQLLAAPATTTVRLRFDRAYLEANAVVFDNRYRKVVIPSTSVFSIGSRLFGLYYAIEIRISLTNGSIRAVYDADTPNPLYTLTTNMIDDIAMFTQDGVDYLDIEFPVYQFQRQSVLESLTAEEGFTKEYAYTDLMYAVRAYTQFTNNGPWTELQYVLSDNLYDRTVATAVLSIYSDTKKLRVHVPQIYFDTGLVGRNLRIEILTTKGDLNNTLITQAEALAANVDFDTRNQTHPYTAILASIPFLQVFPVSTTIVGGTSGLSFEEIRKRVVGNGLYEIDAISPLQLDAIVSRRGFALTRYVDGIDKRIYFANKRLIGGGTGNVPVTMGNINIDMSRVALTDTLLPFGEGSVTILPTTIFRYYPDSDICVPLTDTEVQALSQLNNTALCAELNANVHTRQPFHVVLYNNHRYPQAKTFDLNRPAIKTIRFINENQLAPVSMSVTSASITHVANGTGGYDLRIGVIKSSSMANVDRADIAVLLTIPTKAATQVYLVAEYLTTSGDIDVYQTVIPTDYYLTLDRYIRTQARSPQDDATVAEIALDTLIDVRCLVRSSLYPAVVNESSLIQQLLQGYHEGWLVLTQQKIAVSLGIDLSDGIYNITDVIYGPEEYLRWDQDIYHTYPQDVVARDSGGNPVYTLAGDGSVVFTIQHHAGDTVLDGSGDPLIKHAAGSIRTDDAGRPIKSADRARQFYITTLQLDARLYASDNIADILYTKQVAEEISTYVTAVGEMKSRALENMSLYFRPTKTMGKSMFSQGDAVTQLMDLGLSFSFECLMPRSSINDESVKQQVRDQLFTSASEELAKDVISITAITDKAKAVLGTLITSMNVLGINGSTTVQTLIPKQSGIQPMVANILYVKDDGSKAVRPAIDVRFAVSE